MKRTGLILLVLLSIFITSCSNYSSEQLHGEWFTKDTRDGKPSFWMFHSNKKVSITPYIYSEELSKAPGYKENLVKWNLRGSKLVLNHHSQGKVIYKLDWEQYEKDGILKLHIEDKGFIRLFSRDFLAKQKELNVKERYKITEKIESENIVLSFDSLLVKRTHRSDQASYRYNKTYNTVLYAKIINNDTIPRDVDLTKLKIQNEASNPDESVHFMNHCYVLSTDSTGTENVEYQGTLIDFQGLNPVEKKVLPNDTITVEVVYHVKEPYWSFKNILYVDKTLKISKK